MRKLWVVRWEWGLLLVCGNSIMHLKCNRVCTASPSLIKSILKTVHWVQRAFWCGGPQCFQTSHYCYIPARQLRSEANMLLMTSRVKKVCLEGSLFYCNPSAFQMTPILSSESITSGGLSRAFCSVKSSSWLFLWTASFSVSAPKCAWVNMCFTEIHSHSLILRPTMYYTVQFIHSNILAKTPYFLWSVLKRNTRNIPVLQDLAVNPGL